MDFQSFTIFIHPLYTTKNKTKMLYSRYDSMTFGHKQCSQHIPSHHHSNRETTTYVPFWWQPAPQILHERRTASGGSHVGYECFGFANHRYGGHRHLKSKEPALVRCQYFFKNRLRHGWGVFFGKTIATPSISHDFAFWWMCRKNVTCVIPTDACYLPHPRMT
jgi:hypothetical protein